MASKSKPKPVKPVPPYSFPFDMDPDDPNQQEVFRGLERNDIPRIMDAVRKSKADVTHMRGGAVAMKKKPKGKKPFFLKKGSEEKPKAEQMADGGVPLPRGDRVPRRAYGGGFSSACYLEGPIATNEES